MRFGQAFLRAAGCRPYFTKRHRYVIVIKRQVFSLEELPKRKSIRIKDYDYSTPGAYFITVCTANREKIFWNGVGADIIRPYGINGCWVYEAMGFQANRQTNLAEIVL